MSIMPQPFSSPAEQFASYAALVASASQGDLDELAGFFHLTRKIDPLSGLAEQDDEVRGRVLLAIRGRFCPDKARQYAYLTESLGAPIVAVRGEIWGDRLVSLAVSAMGLPADHARLARIIRRHVQKSLPADFQRSSPYELLVQFDKPL